MKRTFPAGAGALAALVLTACGSTVAGQPGGAGGAGGAAGVTSGGTAVAGAPAGSAGQSGAGALAAGGSTTSGGTVASGASPSGPAASGAVGAPAGGSGGPSVPSAGKPAPIQIGILLYPDLNQFAGEFGGTADAGNQSVEVDTVVSWINKHGGVAGHPVEGIKHDVSLTSNETYDQLAQEACTDFTQDHHVIAAFAPGTAVSDNFPACLQKHGVFYNVSGHWVHDAVDWKQYANMYSPGETDGRGIGQAMVDQVLNRPLAKRGDTVGLMVMEEPAAVRAADEVVKPELAAAGIKVTEYTVPPPASTPDISNSVATDDSAELKMASQNIGTVLFLCPGCLSFFANNADSQKYYPRYVASSLDTPSGINGAANDSTMKSAVVIGWEPDHDIGLFAHPKELADNPTRRLCHAIMAPSGQSTGDLSEYATQVICDSFLEVMWAAQLNPANPLTGPAIQRGVGMMAGRYPSALDFATDVTPTHHGGETEYRTMHWDSSTFTFVYDSARLPFRFPGA